MIAEAPGATPPDRRLITRIMLRNYKSIGACDVSPSQLAFLVGPNGSGKSNFLDAIRFVSDSLRFSINHSLSERGGINQVRRRSSGHPNHFGIRVDFNLRESRGAYAFEIGAEKHSGHRIRREDCWVIPRDGDPQYYQIANGRLRKTSLTSAPTAVEDRLFLPSVSGAGVFRNVYDALSNTGFYNLQPEAIRTPQPPDPSDLLHRDGRNIASVLDRLNRRAPSAKRRVEEYLSKLAPGIVNVDRVGAGPHETLEFRQQVRNARHPWRFYASNMSDGTLRACGVLVSLFQRAGRNALEPWLIGIEEPEVALHPAAAAILVDSLRDAAERAQVVVTTHSADLLDEVTADEIIAVMSHDGETRLGSVNEVGRSALRDHLYSAGELLRMDLLDPDPESSQLAPRDLNLFRRLS